jgi:two-component system chemotaxis response regulator CheB
MIRVAVIEDSRTARAHLVRLFESAGDFQVVGQAGTLAEAERNVRVWRPDLVSLDVFLPDGTAPQAVRTLSAAWPSPIVLASDAPRNVAEVFEALAAGALDLVAKPPGDDAAKCTRFLQLMRALSKVKLMRPRVRGTRVRAGKQIEVLAIASSTGGPTALRELLAELPAALSVPVLVAQHLAPGFEPGLARWLSAGVSLEVAVAVDGEVLKPGRVLLGPSGSDLTVERSRAAVRAAPAQGYHPSADALFESVAKAYGAGVLAVVLSGIGSDGAQGARAVAAKGGLAFAQDRESCAVFGMPAAVAKTGAAAVIAAPKELGRAAAALLSGTGT